MGAAMRIEVSDLGDKQDAWVRVYCDDAPGVPDFQCYARDLLRAAHVLSESLLSHAEFSHVPASFVIEDPAQ